MFKPLIRTIPTLSGNFTLACHLNEYTRDDKDQDTFNVIVREASFIPLQNKLYDKIINANLNSGKYEFEITKYYKHYSNYFYDTNFRFNKDDYQILNKYSADPIEQRNRDYEFGCKRMQKTENDFQFMFYAPIYIDDWDGIADCFKISIQLNETVSKTINVSLKHEKNNSNLLCQYLHRYVEQIDDNVIYCLHDTYQAMYDGVDVKLGGFVRLKDNNIGSIYAIQQTMNNFDYTICDGFARNNIVMKQIIPLSFMFNVDDILTQREKKYFTNHPVKITASYYRDNTAIGFYDFSTDYVDYHLYLKEYDVDNHYRLKKTTNIMDCDYPALHDGFYHKYKYTNKFTPQYCRWKLKYSDDDTPYVTNMNYAFSYIYSDKNNQYGDFPNIYVKKPTMHVKNLDVKRPENEEQENYTNALKNNMTGWFTTVSNIGDVLNNSVAWKQVNDDKVYYRGILYDLNNYLSDKRSSKIHSTSQITDITYSNNILYNIDKFGVFVQPHAINVDADKNEYKLVENVVTLKTTYSTVNCRIYDDFEQRGKLFTNTTFMSQPALYENDVLLKKTSYGNYEIIDDYFSYNTWYNVDDLRDIAVIDYSYVMNTFELLPFDNSNCLFTEDNTSNALQNSEQSLNLANSMYTSDKKITQKVLIEKDKIYADVKDYNYFINRDFVNIVDIPEDVQEYLESCTKYNYVPTYKSDDMVNEDFMVFSKENKIYMNDDYFAYNTHQLFVDEYNLNRLKQHLRIEDELSYIIAYGEPISKQHITDYYKELSKNADYEDTVTIDDMLDNMYTRKSFLYTNDDTCTYDIRYEYISLNSIFTDDEKEKFKKNLIYDEEKLLDDFDGSVYFKRKYYVLTKKLLDASIKNDGHTKHNEPLMIYMVNDVHDSTKINYMLYDEEKYKQLKHTFRSCLIPLIKHVKKIDTYDEYETLVKSNKIHEYSTDCLVYDDCDANGAISLILPGGRNESDNPEKYDIINKIDIKYSSLTDYRNIVFEQNNISVVDNIDDVVRGGDSNRIYHDEENDLYVMRYNGVNYMFYYMNIDYLCTDYSFNMDGDKFNSIYGKYIDDMDTEMFNLIAPYFKESIFNKFTQHAKLMMLPAEFKIPIHYIASLYDNGNTIDSYKYVYLHEYSKNIYDIKYIEKINKKMAFRRYFDNITPLITECKNLNFYHLYYKNIDTYISVNNLYRQKINIYEYSPIKCLMRRDKTTDIIEDIHEYEYKHFNDNLMWNMISQFTITHENNSLTYEQLLEEENEKTTFYYFKKYMLNNSFYQFSDEEINDIMLFLFNKYRVSYISEPLRLNVFKTKRLYKLIYKFILM